MPNTGGSLKIWIAPALNCNCYTVYNEVNYTISYQYTACGGSYVDTSLAAGANINICSSTTPTVDAGGTVSSPGGSCTQNGDC